MFQVRGLPLESRVCIGIFLLFLNNVVADTIKGPPVLENLRSGEVESTTDSKIVLNEFSAYQTNVTSSSAHSREVVNSSKQGDKDPDGTESSAITDAKPEEEKVPTAAGKGFEVQGIRSQEADRLLASDPTNGGAKFEENLYGTSGKSSSTKAVSEDFYRLSRTNGLTTVTAKPGFEESGLRTDEKRNKTVTNLSHQEAENITGQEAEATKSSVENGLSRSKEDEPDGIRLQNRLKNKGKLVTSPGEVRVSHEEEEEREKEVTTRKGFLEENRDERKKTTEDFEKNSEVADLEKVVEKKGNGEPISLINDTYVNYSHYYKTTAGKDLEPDSGNQSGASVNSTNFISEDSGVTHGRRDPKEEVEVVRNVTQPPIEKIIAEQFPRDNGTTLTIDTKFDNELDSRQIVNENDAKNPDNSTKVSIDVTKINDKEDRLKLDAVTIGSAEEEATSSQSNLSLIPRGRTIAFSGANEFPSQETKSTVASTREIDTPQLKKNVSLEKTTEHKPYPYTKSTKASTESTSSGVQSTGVTTEETSAYENTIDRADSEKKIIVTEPSVVIENSIQQYRPNNEKAGNKSLNLTTESQVSASTSTPPLAIVNGARPTNQSYVEESYTDLKTIGVKQEEEQRSSGGNDVSRGGDESKVITAKDENFDVTGNGITEVSVKLESSGSADNRPSYEPSFQPEGTSANRTTEILPTTNTESTQTEAKIASNVDVQTTAEESLLIRSTLNVSEVSTEYPLVKESETTKPLILTTSASNSTTVPFENTTMIPVTTLVNTTEAASTVNVSVAPIATTEANRINEVSTEMSTTTLNPDETSFPSTTSIEYEFVGLSEATVIPSQNISERTPKERTEGSTETITVLTTTVPTVQGLVTRDYSEDSSSTPSSEITVDSFASITEIVLPNIEEKSSTAVPDRILTLTSPSPATELKIEATTELLTNETQTESSGTKKPEKMSDAWSTTDESVSTITNPLEDRLVTTTMKETHFIPVTETSTAESASISNTTAVNNTRTTTAVPLVPSSLRPRIFVSSTRDMPTTTAAMPTEEMDIPQTLSPDEITSLVRIVMKGTCEEVRPHLETVRSTLAKMLEAGTNRSVDAHQIIFHQNSCPDTLNPAPTPTDIPLTSLLVYVVNNDGKFDSALTNILPSLYNESHTSFPVTIHSFLLVQETDSGNAIAVVVVSSVAFICLVLLAGLLFIMRKRQTRFNYGERCRPVSLDAYSLDSVSAYNSVRRKGAARSSKRSYGNPTFEDSSAIPSHPLNFAGLSSFCNDVNAINEEFSSIPQVSAKIDELPPGAEVKNRYANVIPLPETRVPLQGINNDPLTEYINANYVRGPRNATRYYIACQAPMESTVTDFWRMIWEQQCKVIIMLTDLVENGMEKCTEYIPPSEVTDCHRLFGDFQVTLKKRETKEKYAISTLHLKNLENNTFREVFHIWYLWPVNAVQSDGTGLIAVILEARALQRGGPGSIVVHCSPGTGRTGTLIALDLGIRQYEITRTVDVPRVVYTIRRDRAGAVQTKEQYAFIYKALNLYATKLAGGVLEST